MRNFTGMLRSRISLFAFVCFLCIQLIGCTDPATSKKELPEERQKKAEEVVKKDPAKEKLLDWAKSVYLQLAPLHEKKRPPQSGEWLDQHEEKGQSFAEYLLSDPVRANAPRNKIYIRLLGSFSPTELQVLEETTDYLRRFYPLEVKVLDTFNLSEYPAKAIRYESDYDDFQLHTKYVLYDVLEPDLPEDAAAFIALTNIDLYPAKNWNYVFGQASVVARVGVWSMHRYGDPEEGPEAYQRCLYRTIKTASHELGHMFSLRHCIFFECNMGGSNHLEESDAKPHYLCPVCLSKLCWNLEADIPKRLQALKEFWEEQNQPEMARFYSQSIEALQ